MLEILALAHKCAPTVAPQTMAAVVNVESSYNPYAIGLVGARLARQPASRDEAVATAKQLALDGWNFSVGAAQVNRYNLPKYEVTYEQAFDACTNLRIGSKILEDCYVRAYKRVAESQAALHAAFSCYYSGNFSRGFKPDVAGKPSYVQKVLASAGVAVKAIPVVPSIQTGIGPTPQFDKAAPASHKVQLTAPAPDNAPVLLRPSDPAGDNAVRLRPLATGTAIGQLEGVAKEAGAAADEAESTKKAEPNSSVIVF